MTEAAGAGAGSPGVAQPSIFRNRNFVRLWAAQVVSSTGDWIGVVAIIAVATRIAKNNPEIGVSLVMVARMLPGFLLAPITGVLVDRWDRRRTMYVCDICRGLLLGLLPFLESIWLLFALSFVLELFAMLWQPAKEATVPNLVRPDQLVNANSLGMAAAYGTFPIGSGVFAGLAAVAVWLGGLNLGPLEVLKVSQENIAIWVDCFTFFGSATLIFHLRLPPAERTSRKLDMGQTWRELREGVVFIRQEPVVRLVLVGMAAALLGGAAVIPLGATFAKQVLHGGSSAFGLLITALGTGAAIGVVSLSAIQHRFSLVHLFTMGLMACGLFLVLAASVSSLSPALPLIALFGVGAGGAYVTGFAALQDSVDDDLRGRVFAALFTIIRLCMLIALTVAPLLAGILDDVVRSLVPGGRVSLGLTLQLSGTRITLWLGGIIVFLTGLWARAVWNRLRRRSPEVAMLDELTEERLREKARQAGSQATRSTIEGPSGPLSGGQGPAAPRPRGEAPAAGGEGDDGA